MSVGVVPINSSPLSVSTAPGTAEVHLLHPISRVQQTSPILTTLQPMLVPSTSEDTSEQTSPIMTTLQPMVVTAEVHPLPPNSRVQQQTHPILTTLQPMEVPSNSEQTSPIMLRRTQRPRNQKRTYPFM